MHVEDVWGRAPNKVPQTMFKDVGILWNHWQYAMYKTLNYLHASVNDTRQWSTSISSADNCLKHDQAHQSFGKA